MDLAPPHRACLASVAIPAHNEEHWIRRALEALTAQRGRTGAALAPERYEIVIFANGCTDNTAGVVRAVAAEHPRHAILLFEGRLPAASAHVGTARRTVMDIAAERQNALRPGGGAVLTSDADTVVHPQWIAETLDALESTDAVAGRIVVDQDDVAALPVAVRQTIASESAYRFAIARLESRLDPMAYDPWPRHTQSFGGSLAVRAGAYVAAGGVPCVPTLEDVALTRALERNDARIRHSLRVRVTTSGRRKARAPGGLAAYLTAMAQHAEDGAPFLVEHPTVTLARIEARAALRRLWSGAAPARAELDRAVVVRTFLVDADDVRAFPHGSTFGALCQTLERDAEERLAFDRPGVPLGEACAVLRRAAAVFDRTPRVATTEARA